MSMDEREEQDDALIEQLRTAMSAEVPPARVTEAAKAALTWLRVDAELAELLSDSALEAEPALARGDAVVRSVSFSAGETIVELEVHPDGDRRTLLGQLSPAAQRTIVIQQADGAESASAQIGRARPLPDHARGTAARCGCGSPTIESDTAIETAWIPIYQPVSVDDDRLAAEHHPVPGLQPAARDPLAVDRRAVGRFEILDHPGAVTVVQLGMIARHGRVLEHDVAAVGVAADEQLPVVVIPFERQHQRW